MSYPLGLRVVAMVALALVLTLAWGAKVASDDPTSNNSIPDEIEIRVWQHTENPFEVHVSARPAGGSWDTLGTFELMLNGRVTSHDNAARNGSFTVAGAEVNIRQDLLDPQFFTLSARRINGTWPRTSYGISLTEETACCSYRYGNLNLALPRDGSPAGPLTVGDDVSVSGQAERGSLVTVSPDEDDLSQHSPLTIRFLDPPRETDPQQVISIDPDVQGSFGWLDELTLFFQPAAQGWERGQQYEIFISADVLGAEPGYTHAFIAGGGLEVAYTVPREGDVEVPLTAQVLVQFNRSVAPLSVLRDVAKSEVLEFEPPMAGEGEWLNTSLYRFKATTMAPSTEYTVRVRAGLTSAIGDELPSDIGWRFTTVQPAMTAVAPADGDEQVELDSPIVVTFSQPMDRESVESGLLLYQSGSAIAGTFAWNDNLTTVTITPSEPLQRETWYEVVAPQGLRGASAGATRARRSSGFRTIPVSRLVATYPRDGEDGTARSGISLTYNAPIDPSSLEGHFAINGIDPSDIELSSVRWYDWSREFYVNFRVDLDYSTTYTARIAEGVRDLTGQSVPAHEFRFTTKDPPDWPILNLATRASFTTTATGRDQVLYFQAARLGLVKFELIKLSDQESETLLRRGAIDTRRWIIEEHALDRAEFWAESVPVRDWSETIESSMQGETRLFSTILGGDTPLGRGHYLLTATPSRTWNGEEEKYRQQLFISVVDTAMLMKHASGELVVWALDYDTGEPLEGVSVQAASMGQMAESPYLEGDTDANGVVRISIPVEEGHDEAPYWLYVSKIDEAEHFGVSATWWDAGVSPWSMDVPTTTYFPGHRAHLYAERPLYRPGEMIHLKGVIRFDNDGTYAIPADDEEFMLRLSNPRGKVVAITPVELSELGTFSVATTLPDDASIGYYAVSVNDVDGRAIARTSFRVEEFRPPEFQVKVASSDADYVVGDSIAAEALASFFFGGSVTGAAVRWYAQTRPAVLRVAGYEDFTFWDRANANRFGYYRNESLANEETTTDSSGKSRLDVIGEFGEGRETTELTIGATVTDTSGQAITDSTSVTVHPANWYVGIRPESRLGTAGEPTTIHLVSVDFRGRPAPERPVAVRLHKREWIRTFRSDGGGHFEYELQETEVDVRTVTTDAAGEGSVDLNPKAPGSYLVVGESRDEQGRVTRSAQYLWVRGEGPASWPEPDNGAIELIADRERYEVGDVAEILAPASFAGATGLVTFERGGVLTTEVRDFPTNSEVLRIPIEDWHIPNVFIGVSLYRPPTEEDPYPRYNVGYAELRVSPAARQLEVSIRPDRAQAQPGDTLAYLLQVNDADGNGVEADISVAVVDQAVLSLLDDIAPDGMDVFWRNRGLGVRTSTSLTVSNDALNRRFQDRARGDISTGRFNATATATLEVQYFPATGGGEPSEPVPNLTRGQAAEQTLRSNFRNTALWLGQLRTDSDGRARFQLPLPDNATTWRIRARAADAETNVGSVETELLVTTPLLIRPALPRFLRVGDEVVLRTLVRNGTAAWKRVHVSIETDGVLLKEQARRSERISAGRSSAFGWTARAEQEGTAIIRLRAVSGRDNDAVEISIPVLPAVTPESTATGGVVKNHPVVEAILLPVDELTRQGSLEIAVQASLVGTLEDELKRLLPDGRVESNVGIASRIMALVAVEQANPSGLTNQLSEQVRTDIQALTSKQRNDGGWAWCRTCDESHTLVSAWVLLALSEAVEAEFDVPHEVYTKAAEHVSNKRTSSSSRDLRAFLHYVAVRSASADETQSLAEDLQQMVDRDRDELRSWGRAYLILGLLSAGYDREHESVRLLLNDLSAAALPSANGNQWSDQQLSGSMHNSNVRTTAIILGALVEADPDHPLIEETVRWLVRARAARRWQSSVERAQAMSSLGAFADLTDENRADYDYRVLLDTMELLDGAFDASVGDVRDGVEVPLDALGSEGLSLLHFERDPSADGRMYYTLNLRYATPATEVSALNRGFGVSRRYSLLDDPGREVNSAVLGEVVRVELSVVTPAARHFVTITDHLPAGLEPIVPQLNVVSPWLRRQLADDRTNAVGFGSAGYSAPWFFWYYSPWKQVDTRDEGVTLSAQQLTEGVYRYVYYARATTPGDFFVAPAHAQESYFAEVFGRGDSSRFIVNFRE